MSEYAALLERMMQAVLGGDAAAAAALYRAKPDFAAEAQGAVYLRGYRQRLLQIFQRLYPATQAYLGAETFTALALDFITLHPSRGYNIDLYATEFGPYLAATGEDAFLGELATLEAALREIYHLPETPALSAPMLKRQPPDRLTNAHLQLRAASRLMVFSYPVSEYLTAYTAGIQPPPPEPKRQPVLVLRNRDSMRHLPLEEGEFILLSLIAERYTLGAALASERFAPHATAQVAEDFQRWFARWINEGCLSVAAKEQ